MCSEVELGRAFPEEPQVEGPLEAGPRPVLDQPVEAVGILRLRVPVPRVVAERQPTNPRVPHQRAGRLEHVVGIERRADCRDIDVAGHHEPERGAAGLITPAGGDAEHRRRSLQVATALGWAKSYDAEYVALAQALACPLLTVDARLIRGAGHLIETIGPAALTGS
jgi:hypothetical protein